MKEYKYTTTFSSVIKPVVSEDKDKYLALASMVELEKFLPDVDIEKNVDLHCLLMFLYVCLIVFVFICLL